MVFAPAASSVPGVSGGGAASKPHIRKRVDFGCRDLQKTDFSDLEKSGHLYNTDVMILTALRTGRRDLQKQDFSDLESHLKTVHS